MFNFLYQVIFFCYTKKTMCKKKDRLSAVMDMNMSYVGKSGW